MSDREPTTEAGRNFMVEVGAAAYRGGGLSVSETRLRVIAIEDEARAEPSRSSPDPNLLNKIGALAGHPHYLPMEVVKPLLDGVRRLGSSPDPDLGRRVVDAALAAGPGWCGNPESHGPHQVDEWNACAGVPDRCNGVVQCVLPRHGDDIAHSLRLGSSPDPNLRAKSWFEDAHGEVVLLSDAEDAVQSVRASRLGSSPDLTGLDPD